MTREEYAARERLLAERRRFELGLGWLLFGCLGLLILCQAAFYLDREQAAGGWYGEAYEERPEAASPALAMGDGLWGSVTLALEEHSRLDAARVLVNGLEAGCFREAELVVQVCDGDELAVDCSAYDRPVRLKITGASYGIDRGFLAAEIEVCGEVASLGKIVFEADI